MKRVQYILSLIVCFFQVDSRIDTQENIIISDSLAANAEILELVVESLDRKIFKLSIGDFTIMADQLNEPIVIIRRKFQMVKMNQLLARRFHTQ